MERPGRLRRLTGWQIDEVTDLRGIGLGQNKPKIVVVGSSNMDLVVKSPRIPAKGETILGGDFIMTPGGKGVNYTRRC
jgi:hypothetical protein